MPHDWNDFEGRVKEAVGAVTDDDDLKEQGKLDQIKASVDDAVSDFTTKIRSLFD